MIRSSRLFVFHLLNDRSGSPKVLSQLLQHWVHENRMVYLYTSQHTNGFLSDISGVSYFRGWYRFKQHRWLRLLYYSWSQIVLIIRMIFIIKKTDIIYVNTVLPFGAAIVGKLKGARIIYHIHESSVRPALLKWFLFSIVRWTAHDIINVSRYVQQSHGITTACNHLIYNAIEDSFVQNKMEKATISNPINILMVSSLKTYKGLLEFLQLARDNEYQCFRLVLNSTDEKINSFFMDHDLPHNLTIYPSQINLHPFYQWADVVVNLSRPDGWIETFGLTIIEGMVYGLPAIVPPVGGILEVIEEGVTGYSVDSGDRVSLNLALHKIIALEEQYDTMSKAAFNRVKLFNEKDMLYNISGILNGKEDLVLDADFIAD